MARPPSAVVSIALMSLSLALGYLAPLSACDIPVCEYALLNWSRQDYTVYYLHDGTEARVDAEANKLLRKVAGGKEGHANLRFVSLKATQDPEGLSPEDRYVLRTTGELSRPRHLLLSPKGRTVFSGRMTVADVRDLLASAQTASLADMLLHGRHGVLVVMTDRDEAQNTAALRTAQTVIHAAEGTGLSVGLLEVSRQNPKERWLVRQLLQVEADLETLDGPMVFGAYGRGHLTEAYLGKGITAANLQGLVTFMNGPCTCDIKAANLGVDLITNCDWEAHLPATRTPLDITDPGGFVTFGE